MPTNNPSVLDRTSNVGVVAGCLMAYRVALLMSAFGGKADINQSAWRLMTEKWTPRNFKDLFSHAILHESIPASQFNFLCPSLFFAARPFFATFFLLDPRLFSSSINEGPRRKNQRRRLCKCNAADKDSCNGKDCECSKQLEHLYIDPNPLFFVS
jgi:hypothetical protein